MRGIALPDRLRRLGRREVPDLVGRDAGRMLAAPVAAPAAGEQAPPGSLTPEARRQLDEALARGLKRSAAGPHPVMTAGEQPYPASIPVSQVTAYRLAAASEFYVLKPEFQPAAGRAPETAPQPVHAEAPADTLGMPEVLLFRRVRDGLQGLDWAALDAARATERDTYARTIGAPFHNALLAGWQSPVRPARRHGQAVQRRAEALAYPPFSLAAVAGEGAYAGVMEHANRITGTLGTGLFRPALTAGGAA